MSTETELMELMELSSAARRLIAHCSATGHFVADSRAAVVASVPLRNLVHAMEHAVEAGQLRRVRDSSGILGYRVPFNEAAESGADSRNGTATAQTQVEQYQRSHGQEKSPTGPQNESAKTSREARVEPKPGNTVAAKSPAKRSRRLPPLDLAAIPMGLEPKVDGRATSQKRTWDPLFEALAAQQITGGLLPTMRLPPEYGGAVQAAASTWNKERKDGKKIRVARLPDAAVVQREI